MMYRSPRATQAKAKAQPDPKMSFYFLFTENIQYTVFIEIRKLPTLKTL